MKLSINRDGLLSAVTLLNAIVPSRDVNPVLRNIKIAAGDGCILSATDTEVGIRLSLASVQIDRPGEALLPAQRLHSILRESSEEVLVLDAGQDEITVKGKQAQFELPVEDPAHFPDIPEMTDSGFVFPGAELREMIRRVQFAAASAEHARYGAMTGVRWEIEGDAVRLIATDGRRLALVTTTINSLEEGETLATVPVKALALLAKNLDDEEVSVVIRANEILFKTDRATIYSRLVDGRYPNYQQVFPEESKYKIGITVGPLLAAVRQAAVMTDEESKRVKFTFSDNELTLQASGSSSGKSLVHMDLGAKGVHVDISFDPKFITDMLKLFDAETELTLELTDGKSRVVFRNESGDFQYVVVPVVMKEGEQ